MVGAGSVAVVGAALLAALIPGPYTGWRFAVVAAAVGLVAAVSRDGWAVAASVVLGWLVVNGFLVDRMGELSWHGSPDLLRLMLLVLIGGSGLVLGDAMDGLRAMRNTKTENDEKEKRDA
jgi:hypothetical protein